MLRTKSTRFSWRPRRPALSATPTSNPADRVNQVAGAAASGQSEPTKKDIRERAYYIYLSRGGVNGNAFSDWLQAERELKEEYRAAAAVNGRRY